VLRIFNIHKNLSSSSRGKHVNHLRFLITHKNSGRVWWEISFHERHVYFTVWIFQDIKKYPKLGLYFHILLWKICIKVCWDESVCSVGDNWASDRVKVTAFNYVILHLSGTKLQTFTTLPFEVSLSFSSKCGSISATTEQERQCGMAFKIKNNLHWNTSIETSNDHAKI
jgi:hypothetical protein